MGSSSPSLASLGLEVARPSSFNQFWQWSLVGCHSFCQYRFIVSPQISRFESTICFLSGPGRTPSYNTCCWYEAWGRILLQLLSRKKKKNCDLLERHRTSFITMKITIRPTILLLENYSTNIKKWKLVKISIQGQFVVTLFLVFQIESSKCPSVWELLKGLAYKHMTNVMQTLRR